jgi:hypothetical protein
MGSNVGRTAKYEEKEACGDEKKRGRKKKK